MKATNLKNYTTTVPWEKTVGRIESLISEMGAHAIQKDLSGGVLKAMRFAIYLPGDDKREVFVRLPADEDAVYEVLRRRAKRWTYSMEAGVREQARRTAWKIMQDWLEIQLTLIQLQRVEFLQVFLSYVWDGESTFYDRLKTGSFKQLEERTGDGLAT